MYGFNQEKITKAVVKVLNSNYNYIAAIGRYFKIEDIESYEVWFIGIRVKLKAGIFPGRRFTMISKTAVCAKACPSKQEVMFAENGKTVGDRVHLCVYKYLNDDSGQEHIWTVSLGYNTKQQAVTMKHWLWQRDYAAHSIVRRGERTKFPWELKIWELHPEILEALIEQFNSPPRVIKVIKPNGAYRFMEDDQMLIAVYTKPELKFEITKYLKLGYQVQLIDPNTAEVYVAKLVGDKVKYNRQVTYLAA
jgi:hypothetical protein